MKTYLLINLSSCVPGIMAWLGVVSEGWCDCMRSSQGKWLGRFS